MSTVDKPNITLCARCRAVCVLYSLPPMMSVYPYNVPAASVLFMKYRFMSIPASVIAIKPFKIKLFGFKMHCGGLESAPKLWISLFPVTCL